MELNDVKESTESEIAALRSQGNEKGEKIEGLLEVKESLMLDIEQLQLQLEGLMEELEGVNASIAEVSELTEEQTGKMNELQEQFEVLFCNLLGIRFTVLIS